MIRSAFRSFYVICKALIPQDAAPGSTDEIRLCESVLPCILFLFFQIHL